MDKVDISPEAINAFANRYFDLRHYAAAEMFRALGEAIAAAESERNDAVDLLREKEQSLTAAEKQRDEALATLLNDKLPPDTAARLAIDVLAKGLAKFTPCDVCPGPPDCAKNGCFEGRRL